MVDDAGAVGDCWADHVDEPTATGDEAATRNPQRRLRPQQLSVIEP